MNREVESEAVQGAQFADLAPEQARGIDELCDYFEHQLYSQGRPRIESLLANQVDPLRSILLRELLYLEIESCLARDMAPSQGQYFRRFPDQGLIVHEVFSDLLPGREPVPSPAVVAPATLDNYRILRPLNQGGMGRVYEAINASLGRIVAIKVLHTDLARDVEAEAAFEREMKIVGNLSHRCIAHALDAGKWEGTHYLVMEHVVGFDLGEIVQRVGPLRVADACEVARRVALALDHAHHHHLVHRDIKPKNVLLGRTAAGDSEVEVKVVDFGLALLRGYARPREGGVKSNQVSGTFTYMAPEQYWEQTSDIRSDIYSLGCTLYCLLVGRPPFSTQHFGAIDALMKAHRDAVVPSLRKHRPDVTPALESLVLKLLSKRPGDRPATPAEVSARLEPFAVGHEFAALLGRAEGSEEDDLVAAPPPELARRVAVGSAKNPLVGGAMASPLDAQAETDWLERPSTLDAPSNPSRDAPAQVVDTVVGRAAAPSREREKELPRGWRRGVPVGWAATFLAAGLLAVFLAWHARSALVSTPTQDLLALVDPARDRLEGEWRFEGRQLVSPESPLACLTLPVASPPSYKLEIEAERKSGGRLVIGLVWKDRQVPVILDSATVVTAAPDRNSQAAVRAKVAAAWGFTQGRPGVWTCLVGPPGILVASGNEVRLAIPPDETPQLRSEWLPPGSPRLFIGAHNSVYQFRSISLTPQ